MLTRRMTLAVFALAAPLFAAPAFAGDKVVYSDAAFAEAQKAGKSILVDVSATWCPTCKAQAPIISKLVSEPKYQKVVIFSVDFDSQKDALKKFNTSKQSTLIGFKGAKETKRSTGDTNPMNIEDLIESTL